MEQPNFRLDGKTALVTGASRGIGFDLVAALSGAGAQVAAGIRNPDDADRFEGPVLPVRLDVTDPDGVASAIAQIVDHFGSLDILVNNAGIGANHPAEAVTEADWDEILDVNLKGLFFCCQAAGRVMLKQGGGRIINMSSQAGVVGIRDHAVYSASKGGVNLLTKVLALEWSGRGVTVNAVAPTFIYTPGTAERLDDPGYRAAVVERIPIGTVGTTTDVAGAVIYLASEAGRMVTGHVLLVDGGWTSQ